LPTARPFGPAASASGPSAANRAWSVRQSSRVRKRLRLPEPGAPASSRVDWAQREEADARRDDAQRLATNAGVNEFLDEVAAHYRVVCITDHMRCGYATRLAEAARQRDDITVLPGMEINCLVAPHYRDAIHVLAVFPPDVGEVAIERIFAGTSLPEPHEREGTEAGRFDDLSDLRKRIQEIGGIFVLAHVENEKRGHRARFRTRASRPTARSTRSPASHRPTITPSQEYERPGTATLLKVPRCDLARCCRSSRSRRRIRS